MMSRLAMVAKRVIEAAWANSSSEDRAAVAADALESAQLLQSPETVAARHGFFRPGCTYTRDLPFRAPEDRPSFQCKGVGVHPSKGSLRAFGFEQPGAGAPWVSASQRVEEWAAGWVEIGGPCAGQPGLASDTAPTVDAESPAITVYRALWDSIPLGLYTRPRAAREHCEACARRDLPAAAFDWIEDEEDGVAELVATVDGRETPTGHTVTALEIDANYDPEADE
ncbi:hypothetical protein ACFWGL_16980 [Streptomyces sp. NPDC060286]|uniref:hypothetical protein n=1 Tax=unclassified Streptomyces TaxID=2593676 RepID=UPI0035E106BE